VKALDTRMLGAAGERRARWFYRLRGYRIVGANVRLRRGELDLVVQRGRTIAFVEVKTRRSLAAGEGFDAVDTHKRRKLIALAEEYLATRYVPRDAVLRFDVISTFYEHGRFHVTHFPDAFRNGD
jgi:putative endonuclease